MKTAAVTRHKINIIAQPQASGSVVWVLPDSPVALAVYRNGLRQNPLADYSLSGRFLTLPDSADSDTILCDYDY